jgi:hypothetical protein
MLDTTNPQYDKWLPLWKKCRDAIEGQEWVHQGGETYLPNPAQWDAKLYNAYKLRATYFNACGRTLDGMTGLIFRKQPEVIYPTALEPIIDDIDMAGSDLMAFAEQLVDELGRVSRVGILIDYPSTQTVGLTVADAQALGLRPYATIYKTESILDWRFERINNKQMLSMVKLKECKEVQVGEFEYKTKDMIRLLDLFEGRYRVRVYEKGEAKQGKDEWVLISEIFPLMNNAPIREIPFIFDSINGLDSDVKKPVLLDLVNVNLSHYRLTADYKHGLLFTGLPTPVFWGAQLEKNDKINLGSTEALVFASPEGHCEYLEFQGQGLGAIKTALDGEMEQMSALGSRMLSPQKRAAEAAEKAAIDRAGEDAVLASLANSASSALTKTLQWLALWARADAKESSCKLNTDFIPKGMDAAMFRELTNAYLTGAISYTEYFYKLKEGEVIREATTIDEERDNKETDKADAMGGIDNGDS